MMVEVRFKCSWPPYVGGEAAGFTEREARRLVETMGVAVYADTLTSKSLEMAAAAGAAVAVVDTKLAPSPQSEAPSAPVAVQAAGAGSVSSASTASVVTVSPHHGKKHRR
jgi:hypothetical protein